MVVARSRIAWTVALTGSFLVLTWAYLARSPALDRKTTAITSAIPSAETARGQATPPLVLARPESTEERVLSESPPPVPPPPAESVHDKLERLKASVKLIATDKGWETSYDSAPTAALEQEVQRIEDLIFEATKDELEYRFSTGLGVETLSTDPGYKYDGKGYDPTAVYWVRFTPGGPTQKVTLPKEEFPEVYELKALSAWIREEIQQRGTGQPK